MFYPTYYFLYTSHWMDLPKIAFYIWCISGFSTFLNQKKGDRIDIFKIHNKTVVIYFFCETTKKMFVSKSRESIFQDINNNLFIFSEHVYNCFIN